MGILMNNHLRKIIEQADSMSDTDFCRFWAVARVAPPKKKFAMLPEVFFLGVLIIAYKTESLKFGFILTCVLVTVVAIDFLSTMLQYSLREVRYWRIQARNSEQQLENRAQFNSEIVELPLEAVEDLELQSFTSRGKTSISAKQLKPPLYFWVHLAVIGQFLITIQTRRGDAVFQGATDFLALLVTGLIGLSIGYYIERRGAMCRRRTRLSCLAK
jgi:hypothetical protein